MKKEFVYFELCETTSDREFIQAVKIGRSANGRRRQQQHRRGDSLNIDSRQVELLAAVKTDAGRERDVLHYFREDNLAKELFAPSENLADYIRWLRNQHFTMLDWSESEEVEQVHYGHWSPDDATRRIAPPSCGELFGRGDNLDFPVPTYTADDFHTPDIILDPVRATLGAIDLDPASHPIANKRVKARSIFTIYDDGLSRDWYGKMWLNPPFSKYDAFVDKLHNEISVGNIEAVCALFSVGKLTAHYFQPMLNLSHAMCIMRGRHSHHGLGEDKQSTVGHCVVYFGPDVARFERCFNHLGTIWTPSIQSETTSRGTHASNHIG